MKIIGLIIFICGFFSLAIIGWWGLFIIIAGLGMLCEGKPIENC